MHNIMLYDDMDKPFKIDYFYFFDSRNKINLVHPNYEDKLEYFKIVELLAESTQISQPDYNIIKKITMHSYQVNNNYQYYQVCQDKSNPDQHYFQKMQEIKRLKLMLDRNDKKNITSAHILTLATDQVDTLLFITSAPSNIIEMLFFKDRHGEVCLEF